ncbi:hypothetical protein NUU61_008439 [Penicillium alfredii]|uniref:Uncharacterized protein n=1 Tax=Penicillium alfredii TaxID=1506179 RepID=A0A9W9ELF9_9EURO|nr:uncharacterized protein NUU61_008439 [Penicillium alfredii]KAJ5083860.1 hypothetical protein NUU61_008439 [Penicillium alfredii]
MTRSDDRTNLGRVRSRHVDEMAHHAKIRCDEVEMKVYRANLLQAWILQDSQICADRPQPMRYKTPPSDSHLFSPSHQGNHKDPVTKALFFHTSSFFSRSTHSFLIHNEGLDCCHCPHSLGLGDGCSLRGLPQAQRHLSFPPSGFSIPPRVPTGTPVFSSEPVSLTPGASIGITKRGESLSVPTDLPSLESDAQSVAAALASAGAQKRDDGLSVPTDLPSFVSDAQSVAAALASAGAQKRAKPPSIPTNLPSFLSDAQSIAAAFTSSTPSGLRKRGHSQPVATHSSTPTGIPARAPSSSSPVPFGTSSIHPRSSSRLPLPTPTGLPSFSFPFA